MALVALPLSIAIAIASGATPRAGLVTAIIGGFLISLLGGSRVQIGGPTGAFIVVVASIIEQYGFDGLTAGDAAGRDHSGRRRSGQGGSLHRARAGSRSSKVSR